MALYEAAETYLRGVMNGRTTIPTSSWKKEAAQLNAERQTLYADYTRLKEEVKDAEVIRCCVENVLHEPKIERSREQGHGMEWNGIITDRAAGYSFIFFAALM